MTQPPEWPGYISPPPPPGPRPVRGARVALGIGIALGAHLLTIGLGVAVGALARASDQVTPALITLFVAQLLVFIGCLVAGILLIVRSDRGMGIGLLIGWALGVFVLPVIGVGLCIAYFATVNGTA
jgi:hypothetical protein